MSKKWYKSRILWVNIVGAVSILIQTNTKFVIPIEIQSSVLFVLNILLRFNTSKAIE